MLHYVLVLPDSTFLRSKMPEKKYYRNKEELQVNGEIVDPGSLWRIKGDTLVLVDDDRYVSHPVTAEFE